MAGKLRGLRDLRRLHTFVICAYQESPYLEACIRSILAQDSESTVLIATSTPSPYIERLAGRYGIPVEVNEGKGGIGNDWNFALSCCHTPYATLVHQDDIYGRSYGETAVRLLEKAHKPLIFFCGYGELRGGGNREKPAESAVVKVKRLMLAPLSFRVLQGSPWIRRRILSFGNAICCPSVTYCLENLPAPLFTGAMKSNLDWLAWERISRLEGAFVYCREPLMCHRIHEGSTTSRLLGVHGRSREDYMVFCRFWPKKIARVLTRLYRSSEKSNRL